MVDDSQPRLPATMRAAIIHATGGVENIRIERIPLPQAGPGEVLVRLEASGLNHVDLFVRSGAYATALPFPFVIGRDLVGSVVRVGEGVDGFAAGDRVWSNSLGHAGRQGAWSEYAAVEAARLYPLPAGVDARSAAAVLHAGATAWLGLFRHAALRPGQLVLVEGGAGAVGSAVVQMAHAAGARVIATAAADDAAWCRSCGAAEVLDYRRTDLPQAVHALAPDGIDLWWDCSGRNDFGTRLPLLRLGGAVVLMSGLRGRDPLLPVAALYTRDITLHGFAISNAAVDELAGAAQAINRLLADGRLEGRIAAVYPLERAAAAHRALAEGGLHGRIVLVP